MVIHAVLPAYNEAEAISPLLCRFKKLSQDNALSIQILVVDDGSKDATAEVAQSFQGLPVTVIKHARNSGLGAATNTGLKAAAQIAKPDDIIVLLDADDTHHPGQILRMLIPIKEGYEVVIASRYIKGARIVGTPFFRQIFSIGASWLFRLIYPIPGVRDYTCGYRAYRAETLQRAFEQWGDQFISETGFTCMVDILLKLDRMKAIMTEIPLLLRYDRKPGKSKMDVRRTIGRTIELLLRRRFGQW